MIRTPFRPGWYGMGTVLNSGHAVLVADSHINTHLGHLPLPGAENALFLVCTYWQGVFVMGAQGHGSGHGWLWNGTEWKVVSPTLTDGSGVIHWGTVGTSPCAFGPLGLYIERAHELNLLVVDPLTGAVVRETTQALGARGIAYVDPAGRVWSTDECYGMGGMAETVPVRPDLIIGQGWNGGTEINYRGIHYLLEPGDVQFHRVDVQDDHLAIAMWKFKETSCVVHWLTEGEIPLLPKVVAPVPVPPNPEPTPEPPTPIPEPPVPVPEPPPVEHFPPLKTSQRYWIGPNIDTDIPIFIHMDLSGVDVFSLYVQWVKEDARWAQIDTLKDIRSQGVNLGIEMGSLKPGDYHGEQAQADLPLIAERVLSKGHQVGYLIMDEPLTATYQAYDAQGKLITLDQPVQPLEESAFAIAKFVEKAREAMPGVKVCWAEAWPEIPLETMRKCLLILDSWGCHLDGWHLDVDWKRAQKEGSNPYNTIRLAKTYADDYKAPLGVYLAGYPHATDQDYFLEVVDMAKQLHTEAHWCVDHVLVQSWAVRVGTGKQDLPANSTPDGLWPLFYYVATEIFV